MAADLEQRLAQALQERDDALLALARERERTEALRLWLLHRGETELPEYPAATAPGEPPLRYVLVDRVNDGLKRVLGPLQRTVKSVVSERDGK